MDTNVEKGIYTERIYLEGYIPPIWSVICPNHKPDLYLADLPVDAIPIRNDTIVDCTGKKWADGGNYWYEFTGTCLDCGQEFKIITQKFGLPPRY